jgi:AraC-like DNA-binding protein
MPGLESFSTETIAPAKRLDYWNELNSKTSAPTVTDSIDLPTFCPSLTRTRVDCLWMGLVHSSPAVVHHTREHVSRTREALFFLQIQVQGSSHVAQDGREADLRVGDFVLLDSSRPYHMSFDAANKVLVVGIPDSQLRRQLAHPDRLVAFRMSYQESLNSLLSDFARGCWRQCESGVQGAESNLASALLNLTAAAYANLAESHVMGSEHMEAMRLRILRHIEKHLGDSDLSPKSIAGMLATSSRYVHSIFTRGDETVSRYILRRRLEESARVLASASQRSRSVSAIAFDYGFASCTNFGKVFREHYGMTPTEYRHEHCQVPAPERREPASGAVGNQHVGGSDPGRTF